LSDFSEVLRGRYVSYESNLMQATVL